jgi:lysozyme-like protein/ricin-type beta-trefoil lectin protein
MGVVTGSPAVRLMMAGAVSLVLAVGPALAGSGHHRVPPRAPGVRPASAGPGAAGRLSPASLARAARTCAAHAAAAGWADNGSYGGYLVTAAAVCVAESGGNPRIYYCDATGAVGFYPPVRCAKGFYDRGLWQLNSRYQAGVSDICAFRAQCNANAAYRISDAGTSFAPWMVYGSDSYTRYLDAAQAAVDRLTVGAVPTAEFGVCLSRASPAAGAAAVTGRCGRRGPAGQWTVDGGTIRQAALCLTAEGGAAQPAVGMRPCDGSAGQVWLSSVPGQLQSSRNATCLDDPGGSLVPGTALVLARCGGEREQVWWLP